MDYNTLVMINERLKLIDSVNAKIKILTEVLDNYDASTSNTDEKELVAELGEACKKVRPNIHQVALEMEEGDESIREILLVSDELNRVLDRYRVVSETTPEVIDLDSIASNSDFEEEDDWTLEELTEAIKIANRIEEDEAMEEDDMESIENLEDTKGAPIQEKIKEMCQKNKASFEKRLEKRHDIVECDKCHKSLHLNAMYRHMDKMHGVSFSLRKGDCNCPYCNKTFKTEKYLKKHLKGKHQEKEKKK